MDSLNKGIIIPGMSYEQVLVAGGIIASNHRNHSIWVVDSEGYLRYPPTVIPEDVLTASIVENRTQYNSVYPINFVVYFERGKVTKVAQTYKLHHLRN